MRLLTSDWIAFSKPFSPLSSISPDAQRRVDLDEAGHFDIDRVLEAVLVDQSSRAAAF